MWDKKMARKKVEAKSSNRQKNVKKSSGKTAAKGIKKQYLKSGNMCNVTFMLPKAAAPDAKCVTIVGDFNGWDTVETPLKKLKNSDVKVTLELLCDREYRFRYLIDANRWENDWFADRYVPNCYGCDDSVVVV